MGIVLILLDLFFIPGGIVAFFGLALVVYADYRAFQDLGNSAGWAFTLSTGIVSILLLIQFFRASFWNKFGPKDEIDGRVNTEDLEKVQIGDHGIAIGVIRPSGNARFGDHVVEVHAKHQFIAEHSRVEIVRIEENKIIVKPIDPTS
ncbi:MAG: NfeD family protein [Bacteroidota bacterium]|nr:NfeD family protein [Bacteroidota bacterium]MDX5430901.1 NfeD family protein [Bacteroidota bacterium]MDX5469648.1 NfeD family protein [Bacteroidota bacterium]